MLTLGKPFVTHPYQALQGNETSACWHKKMSYSYCTTTVHSAL